MFHSTRCVAPCAMFVCYSLLVCLYFFVRKHTKGCTGDTMFHVGDAYFFPCPFDKEQRHSLDEKSKAAFICDAWTGFFSTAAGQGLRRDNFYKLHNIEPPFRPPGGWSYHGQPCDQLHSCFRKAIRRKDLCSLGMEADLRHRQRH